MDEIPEPKITSKKGGFYTSCRKVTQGEKMIRFGCGSVVGAFSGFLAAMEVESKNPLVIIVFVVIGMVLCGKAAVKKGDEFWGIFHR